MFGTQVDCSLGCWSSVHNAFNRCLALCLLRYILFISFYSLLQVVNTLPPILFVFLSFGAVLCYSVCLEMPRSHVNYMFFVVFLFISLLRVYKRDLLLSIYSSVVPRCNFKV